MTGPDDDVRRAVLRREAMAELPGHDPTTVELLLWTSRLSRLMEVFRGQTSAGLDPSGHAVLATLFLAGPPHRLSPTFLTRTVVQTSGGMAKTLRRLQAERLVSRARNDQDGRMLDVVLTDKGRALVSSSLEDTLRRWESVLDSVHDIDREQVASAVTSLVAGLEGATGYGGGT